MKYPDDANGDALRRMEAGGDDLPRPRGVEFTVVFPNENTAKLKVSRSIFAILNAISNKNA